MMAVRTPQAGLQNVHAGASEEEKSLPFSERIQLLDQEIRLLRECCLKLGLNGKEIERCGQPFLKERRDLDRKKWWSRVFFASFFVGFISFILWYEPTYRYICIFAKLSSIKLLPYWDWTSEYEKDCLIENPYFVADALTEEECETCRNLSGLRLQNVSQDEMADQFFFNSIPVVIADAAKDWPLQSFNINALKEIYLDSKHASAEDLCIFDAFDPEIASVEQLFSLIDDQTLRHWQGYWENCEPAVAKSIRKFYRRPYFLPPMAESASTNWIFAAQSSDEEGSKFEWEEVSFAESGTWITQVTGKSQIVLSPKAPCDKMCKKMSATLTAGETFVFVNRLWNFKRRPLRGEVSMSIAAGVNWDQLQ